VEQLLGLTDQSDAATGAMRRLGLFAAARTPKGRILALSGSLVIASLALLALAPPLSAPMQPHLPWWMLVIPFAAAESFVVHLRVQRHAHSLSLSEVPLVVGLVLIAPAGLVIAQTLGVGMALGLHRRQRAFRLGFNLAQRCFTTVFAILVFHAVLSSGDMSWPLVSVAGVMAVLLADVLAGLLINTGILLAETEEKGIPRISGLGDGIVGVGTLFAFANAALGLMTTMMIAEHPAGVILVLSPAATTLLAGRAYSMVKRQHEDLTQLFQGTRVAESSLDLETMLHRILVHARGMFRADVAEVILLPEGLNEAALSMSQIDDKRATDLTAVQLDPWEGVTAQVVAQREGVLLARPIANHRLAAHFAAKDIRDAMVVPLLRDDVVLGTFLVGNRQGEFSTFDRDDLKLLGTLANHLAVAIQNVRLVSRLESSLAHETEMNELKDDFIATISHELRTPLTSVQGYLKTLLHADRPFSTEEREEFLQRAESQAERLRLLIEDLLFAGTLDGAASPARTVVDVEELIQRVVGDAGWDVTPSRVALLIQSDLPAVDTAQEHVYRIVRNLLENALKYSPCDRTVTLSATTHDGGVCISVQDEGPGIEHGEQEKIFDRFYQVDQSSTRMIGGAGMGLYICRQAAQAVGGRVWLDRSDATGSTFCLWLPLARTQEPSAEERPTMTDVVRI
jgi:signal transduction histidine kinase